MMASAGSVSAIRESAAAEQNVFASTCRLPDWLEKNNYNAYETLDGLNATVLRPLALHNEFREFGLCSR
jgi:hypothetical protein